jgi:hypothetical protein|tara:strand:- start:634 stop:873 length:240 start_codon:yes stop_codon:yes gene_type:complete
MDPITTKEDFNDKFENSIFDFEVKHYESELNDPLKEYHSDPNYQTYEAIKGWIEDPTDSAKKLFRPNMRVHFQKSGLYG